MTKGCGSIGRGTAGHCGPGVNRRAALSVGSGIACPGDRGGKLFSGHLSHGQQDRPRRESIANVAFHVSLLTVTNNGELKTMDAHT